MKWLKRLAIILGLLAGIAFVIPFLVPVKQYIPALQKLASERLGEPVAITHLKFALLPLPSVTVEGVLIGQAQDVRVGAVTVRPDVLSLLREVKVIRAVEVEGVDVGKALLERIPRWTKSEPGSKTVVVRRVEARAVQVALDNFRWGPLRAEVQLGEAGVRAVEAGTEDRRLTVNLVPEGEAYQLNIQGKHWPLPVNPPIQFDELRGKGTLSAHALDLPQIDGKLYGGELRATSRVNWKDGIRIKGDARVAGVEIGPIVQMLNKSTALSGRLHASGNYALGAKNASQLGDSLRASFKFEVRKGVLYNFDLATAVRTLAREGTRGGQTSFNQLSGTVTLIGKHTQLRNLRVASGLLQANGNVDIAANKKLSGMVNVEMTGTASLVSVPLDVSGTLQSPVLFPNIAALTGAAVGTGLMGPGFGTGVGVKAGEALDKFFK